MVILILDSFPELNEYDFMCLITVFHKICSNCGIQLVICSIMSMCGCVKTNEIR